MRLIDADILKKELSKMEDEYKSTLNENCNDDPFSDGVLSALFTVFNTINNQPTAFDVDKVCEQLQENSVMMGTSKCAFDYPPDEKYIEEVVKSRTAFEIVERGGIDES